MSDPAGTERRHTLVYAMDPALTPDLLDDDLRAAVRSVSEVLSEEPLTEFESESAREILARAEILFTGWGCPQIDGAVLARAPHLRLVAHAASSVKPIAAPEVWEAGIAVVSAAEAAAAPVAEYALAAILFANKGVFAARERLRTARAPWRYPWTAPGEAGNRGAVVGVVGASRTGRRVLDLLGAFELRRLVFDPFVSAAEARALGAASCELDDLLRRSDVVTLHAPAVPETRLMIDRRRLALMRDGATLVNTARGALVDHAALTRELASGRLNAVLDVTEPEPLPADSPLFYLANVFLTPHVAGAAGAETRRMAELALDEVRRFSRGEQLRHQVAADALGRLA